uniref:CX domain-containing protein n=1 Tax=Haemonchus placei TaxID=6290 RepID=A0A0N4WRD2_HAEPC
LIIVVYSGQPGGFNPSAGGGFHPQPNQGGFHPNQGGFQPNQGGFRPQPNAGGFHPQGGFQGGFHPNQGGFRPGSGLGSSSSSSAFKTALVGGALGAVGGLVAYEAGKAIIKSATQPPFLLLIKLQLNPTTTTTTSAPVTDADGSTTTAAPTTMNPNQVLNNLQFADGSRPKTISWGCKRGVEVCCGTDCCPAPVSNNNAAPGAGGSVGGGGAAGVALG